MTETTTRTIQAATAAAERDLRGQLESRLLLDAEIARRSEKGRHPRIPVMTQAAALRYAADVVAGRE